MKKVLVIGSGGAGKSTFAKRLHKATDLPLIHLDQIYWLPDWVEPKNEEWEKFVEELITRNEWILDGNFGGTMEMRMKFCDTVIWLDLSPAVCVYRALKRNLKYYKKVRPDMSEGCHEKIDLRFLWWILTFKQSKSGIKLRSLVEKYKDEKNIFQLKSNRDVENFFKNLAKMK